MSFRKVDSDIKDNNFEKEEKDNNQIMYDEFETNFGENQEEDLKRKNEEEENQMNIDYNEEQ